MDSAQAFFGPTGAAQPNKRSSSIDIITYIASLASDPRAIDPILDDVRSITSLLKPSQLPGPEDTKKLADVYFRLENYLTRDEPLRLFTKENLRHKVSQKFQVGGADIEAYWQQAVKEGSEIQAKPTPPETIARRQHVRTLGSKIMWGSFIVGFASLFIPAIPSPETPFSNNFDMAFSLIADLLLFGATWLFIKGLAGFKAKLKTIYRLLCAAMIMLALAQSQQVIYTYFDLWSVPFIQQGGVALGFVPATILFYIAMYKFARLLKVKGFASSLIAMLVTGGAIAGLAAVLPIPSPLPPEILRQALPPSLMMTTIYAFATLMALAIRSTVTPGYIRAMAWLFIGLASVTVISLLYAMIQIFLPPNNAFLAYGGISLLFILTGLFMVRSAVAFNLITED